MDKKKLEQLREKLEMVHKWPIVYLFKFIVTSEVEKIKAIKTMFDESAEITSKESKNGNYTSLSIKMMVMKSDEVFDRYLEASKIEGVISL